MVVIDGSHAQVSFDPRIPAVAEIEPGSTVRFDVDDAVLARLAAGESIESIGPENLNTVTGPVGVRGAKPGDALRVDVLEVEISRAWTVWLPQFGPLGRHTNTIDIRELSVDGAGVRIGDSLRVPLQPMIGCIGLAPSEGSASTMRPTYPFGGNMDL